jgi:hypothetical protein
VQSSQTWTPRWTPICSSDAYLVELREVDVNTGIVAAGRLQSLEILGTTAAICC